MTFIPIYEPYKAKNQKKYVIDCIDSNWISSRGSYIDKFENALCKYLGTKHAITVCNGSVSLMLILRSLGIGYGNEVITSSLTYAATVSSINNVGATAVLVGNDKHFQMSVDDIYSSITDKTKAIMVPQLYGDSADLDRLITICDDYNIALIEDSAEAFGSTWNGKMIGTFGLASSFSFFGNKTISTGEGGCVCTDDDLLAKQMRLIKSQNHIGGFMHNGPGYNFRMTNIQAAIGLAQLEEIDKIISKKKKIAAYYRKHLTNKIVSITPSEKVNSAEWMPVFLLPENTNYKIFSAEMSRIGIDTRPIFVPIHLMDGFNIRWNGNLDYLNTQYGGGGFNLPCYPDLKMKQLKYICDSVNSIIEKL